MVKNLPSKAGDVASISGCRTKVPHVTEQLSPGTTTTELHATARETASYSKRLSAAAKTPCSCKQTKVHMKQS